MEVVRDTNDVIESWMADRGDKEWCFDYDYL